MAQQNLTRQLKVPKTNAYQWLQMGGGLQPHYNSLKPFLTEQNMNVQLIYALNMINTNDKTKFQFIYDLFHNDEKWFYLMRDRQQFMLVDEELPPHSCECHKGHSTKVMCLCAVMHTWYNNVMNSWWERKLGIWPIVKQ